MIIIKYSNYLLKQCHKHVSLDQSIISVRSFLSCSPIEENTAGTQNWRTEPVDFPGRERVPHLSLEVEELAPRKNARALKVCVHSKPAGAKFSGPWECVHSLQSGLAEDGGNVLVAVGIWFGLLEDTLLMCSLITF